MKKKAKAKISKKKKSAPRKGKASTPKSGPKKVTKKKVVKKKTAKKKAPKKTPLKKSKFNVVVKKRLKAKPDLAEKYRVELPYSYNQTKLVLLPRDPEDIFLYWDFSSETWNWIQDLFKTHEHILPKLRVYVVDQDEFYEVDVQLESKKWYVCLPVADQTLYAELGLMDENGTFHSIAKSNLLKMPRDVPSKVIDPNWAPIDLGGVYGEFNQTGYIGSSEYISSPGVFPSL